MARQRLVAWSEEGFMPNMRGMAAEIKLDQASLRKERPQLAELLRDGRIVSHHVYFYGYGVLFTFMVEDDAGQEDTDR
jgi:hypothetical protein